MTLCLTFHKTFSGNLGTRHFDGALWVGPSHGGKINGAATDHGFKIRFVVAHGLRVLGLVFRPFLSGLAASGTLACLGALAGGVARVR